MRRHTDPGCVYAYTTFGQVTSLILPVAGRNALNRSPNGLSQAALSWIPDIGTKNSRALPRQHPFRSWHSKPYTTHYTPPFAPCTFSLLLRSVVACGRPTAASLKRNDDGKSEFRRSHSRYPSASGLSASHPAYSPRRFNLHPVQRDAVGHLPSRPEPASSFGSSRLTRFHSTVLLVLHGELGLSSHRTATAGRTAGHGFSFRHSGC
jgi:hypothetical protein